MTDNFWNTLRKPQYNRETTRNSFFHHKKRWCKPLLKFQLIALRAAFSIGSPTRVSSRKVSEWQLANTRIVLTGISDIGWISWLPLVKIFNLSISVSTERQKLIFFQNSKTSLKKSSKSWYQKNLEKTLIYVETLGVLARKLRVLILTECTPCDRPFLQFSMYLVATVNIT